MRSKRIVIVGGGVVGAACAHYLADAGHAVTLLDKDRFGAACSHGNCGLVCPSHVLPLAEPGAVGKALRALFQRNAPFRIKPRLDPALWAWLFDFARRCNADDMLRAGHALRALLDSTMRLYHDLVERDGLECEWEERGLLFAYRDPAEFEAYAATDRLLAESFDHPARRLSGRELAELEPALKGGLAGAWFYEHDAHLRPDRLLASWRRSLEARGVSILDGCAFEGFARSNGRPAAARTPKGELPADAFIIATGAWTPLLARHLGCRIPIQPGKGYSITMPSPARCPVIPLIFPETRVAVTPMRSGYRLGSTMEFAGYDDSLDRRRLDLLREGAAPFLHEPTAEPIEEVWYGWRPMTSDSLPLIGFAPCAENVVIAAGHSMLGVTLAPVTGKLVSELISGQPPHVDPRPYAPTRF